MGEKNTTKRLSGSLADLEYAAALLRAHQLVAIPTETVYGLAALSGSPKAVQRIFEAKGRPLHNPLIVHAKDSKQAFSCFDPGLSSMQAGWFERLAAQCWPGPLTLVFNKDLSISSLVTAGGSKVAVRVPKHPLALQLLELVGEPLVAPSANLSFRPSPTTAEDVLCTLDGKIHAVVDGGACVHGLESTVLDISSDVPTILRLGALSKAHLEGVLEMPTPKIPSVILAQRGCCPKTCLARSNGFTESSGSESGVSVGKSSGPGCCTTGSACSLS